MYFQDFASMAHMGGHGIYVWSTYGIGLLIIAYNILAPMMARRKIVAQITRQIRTQKQSRRAKDSAPVSSEGRVIKRQQTVSVKSRTE